MRITNFWIIPVNNLNSLPAWSSFPRNATLEATRKSLKGTSYKYGKQWTPELYTRVTNTRAYRKRDHTIWYKNGFLWKAVWSWAKFACCQNIVVRDTAFLQPSYTPLLYGSGRKESTRQLNSWRMCSAKQKCKKGCLLVSWVCARHPLYLRIEYLRGLQQ